MNDAAISLAVLAVTVGLFVWNRLPVEVVAVGSALLLSFTGVLTVGEALAGFGDAAVVMIAALFVVSEGLDATGVTTWVGGALAERAGGNPRRLLVLTMLLCAGLTAVIGVNGAVAALLPMAVVVALRYGYRTSRLLMPLAFAGSAGGLLLLTGSPVNVVISDAAANAGFGPFGLAEFALAGVPVLAGTILVVMLFGNQLLPERTSKSLPPDLSRQARVLVEHYDLGNIVHLWVSPYSPLIGTPRMPLDLTRYPGIKLVAWSDAETGKPVSEGPIAARDRLTLLGDAAVADRFAADLELRVSQVWGETETARSLINPESGAAELLVPPRSRFVGEKVSVGQVIGEGRLVVLAIERQGRDLGDAPTALEVGDALLVEGAWASLDELSRTRDILVVDSPDLVRRQAVPLGRGSRRAIAILGGMVVLLATGAVPPAVAALLAAMAILVLRVLTPQQAYRGISWTTVLLVAGMMPMSTAITKSGAGEMIANVIVGAIGETSPFLLLAGLFVITAVFGQLISNTATALVMIPIGLSAAAQAGIPGRTVLMSICVASAAAFLTPVATPANMMVMEPGGYRFGDYWKLGLPLILLFFVVSVGLVPLVWGL